MKNQEVFNQVKKIMERFLKDEPSGHDSYHAERVFNTAMNIQKVEGGDALVVGIAALMHDLLRPWEKRTGKSHFGEEALKIIKKNLNLLI